MCNKVSGIGSGGSVPVQQQRPASSALTELTGNFALPQGLKAADTLPGGIPNVSPLTGLSSIPGFSQALGSVTSSAVSGKVQGDVDGLDNADPLFSFDPTMAFIAQTTGFPPGLSLIG